jgi:peptidoglycan/LPS O-acetylase OafA/YrhL
MNEQKLFFSNLNGLRFMGALLVFVFHVFSLNREIWGDFYQTTSFQLLYKITNHGHIGVSLFFVLSGFLITYLFLNELKTTGKINLIHFIFRRILRIWPLYFLVSVFGFFVFPQLPFGITTIHEFWRYALFLSNFDEIYVGMQDKINFLTTTWSISVEEQYYYFWVLAMGAFRFKRHRDFAWFFSLIILVSLVFRAFYISNDRVLYYHTLALASDLAVGGLIALWAFTGKAKIFINRITKIQLLLIYILGLTLILIENKLNSPAWIVVQRLFHGLFFAFILLEQVYSVHSFWKADKVVGFEKSGRLTYGFYLYHSIVIYYCAQLFEVNGWTRDISHFGAYVVLVFGLTYSISWLSFRYFELPILQLKRKFR